MVRSGANQLHGISFSIRDSRPLAETARRGAVADAAAKAATIGLGRRRAPRRHAIDRRAEHGCAGAGDAHGAGGNGCARRARRDDGPGVGDGHLRDRVAASCCVPPNIRRHFPPHFTAF
ncbi:MAG: hypothetical protein FJX64_06670 [Alphaproteobacteria bacterium]|nr:hypothetical protein [Alphaproteobacteria bacterium]